MSMRQGSNPTAAPRPRTPTGIVYEEYSPVSEWKEDEQSRILVIYLPGFRKEQLKVATEGTNKLRVRGERLIGGRKSSRFQQEYQIPTDSTIQGINAKFETGILTITMPKINVLHKGPNDVEYKKTQDLKETVDKPKEEYVAEALKTTLSSEKDKKPVEEKDKKEIQEPETGNTFHESKENENIDSKAQKIKNAMKRLEKGYLVNVGVAVMIIVASGAYIAYAFGSYGKTSNA